MATFHFCDECGNPGDFERPSKRPLNYYDLTMRAAPRQKTQLTARGSVTLCPECFTERQKAFLKVKKRVAV